MTTQLKICGIRSLSEIQELKDLPIDYFGCIFAPKSPRYVSVDLAKDIVTEIHSVGLAQRRLHSLESHYSIRYFT